MQVLLHHTLTYATMLEDEAVDHKMDIQVVFLVLSRIMFNIECLCMFNIELLSVNINNTFPFR